MDSNLWYKHPILLMIEQIKKFNRKITEKKKIKIILMIKYIKRLKKEEKKKGYKQSNDEY